MDSNTIKVLLEKYYSGETSIEEERMLKDHFRKDNLNDIFFAENQMISYFNESKTTVPSDLNSKLNDIVEEEFAKETKSRFSKVYRVAVAVAAILLLSLGIYFITNQKQVKEPVFTDTYKNPQKAYAETQKVLMYISNTMNRKAISLKYLSKVDYSMKQVTRISKINETINEIEK